MKTRKRKASPSKRHELLLLSFENRERALSNAGSPCIMEYYGANCARVNCKGSIESIIGKRAVVIDNHSRVYTGSD